MEKNISSKKPLLILTGPTAVGKTECSIYLAKKINGEIISADSMQVYKNMDIGTAKIKKEQMQGVKHYLIDELNPDEEFNVFKFKEMAYKYINEIYEKGKIPILVGGTGFYIQAVLYDIKFNEYNKEDDYRKKIEDLEKEKGIDFLYDKLKEIDPEYAKIVHKNNKKRVIRALEYFYQTGEQFSIHNQRESQRQASFNYFYAILNQDRKILYDKINKRIDIMLEEGLVKEVKNLLDKGYEKNLVSMQGLGYKEIVPYLEGEISLEQAIETLKKRTRNFAKRQLTWFKREKNVCFFDKDNYSTSIELADDIINKAKENGIVNEYE